jgi:hypothetical protein
MLDGALPVSRMQILRHNFHQPILGNFEQQYVTIENLSEFSWGSRQDFSSICDALLRSYRGSRRYSHGHAVA